MILTVFSGPYAVQSYAQAKAEGTRFWKEVMWHSDCGESGPSDVYPSQAFSASSASSTSVLDLLFGSRNGASPIPTALFPNLSPL